MHPSNEWTVASSYVARFSNSVLSSSFCSFFAASNEGCAGIYNAKAKFLTVVSSKR